MVETQHTESLTDKLLKWSGRIAIGFTVTDVAQSLFTGEPLNKYIHNSSYFVAYSKDALLFLAGVSCELGYRRNMKSKEELARSEEALHKFEADLENYTEEDELFPGDNSE